MASRRSRQSTSDPPEDYQQSRAALRERYGTRAIDASAPQSSRDYTPSGRQKYLEQEAARQRITPAQVAAPDQIPIQAKQQVVEDFKEQFRPKQIVPQTPMLSRQTRQQPALGGGFQGTLVAPDYNAPPSPLGLLPETASPDDLSPFLPTVSPLTGFALPKAKPTYLGSPLPSRFSRYG